MLRRILAIVAFTLSAIVTHAAETYTYPQLVSRLTDLQHLAQLPAVGEKVALASSFSRDSTFDVVGGRYLHWDADNDNSGIVRQEGDDSVLMDVQGPGCIWRIWSAQPSSTNHLKIFLDGAAVPQVDLPFLGYFDGKTAPFNRPNLVYTPSPTAPGFDNYTPIPFRKSCKIVGDDPAWSAAYQFTYSQFPAETVLPTFHLDLSPAESSALDHADQTLGQSGACPGDRPEGAQSRTVPLVVKAGQTEAIADFTGAGAVTELKVKLDLPKDAEAQRILLRQLTLSITWDGASSPSVWSPLGDFFGYVGGGDAFQSLPCGLSADGTFYSYWYMPYAQGAHLEVSNDGTLDVPMTWHVTQAPLSEPSSNLGRFHAKWHRDAFPPRDPGRAIDWTLLTTQGSGRYVGTHLHVWNPRGGWWGEGDDKFFVDGEKFPSSFGTGSADYFGFGESSAVHFSRPYHNQILNEDNAGHVDDNRWHISDAVPFTKSLEADIEKYYGNDRGTLYAAEAFWYLKAGGIDPYPMLPVADRAGYWTRPDIHYEPGAIEGESLRPVDKPPGLLHAEDMWQWGKLWSGDRQLNWAPQAAGDVLRLALPGFQPGKYRLVGKFTRGPSYGAFQLAFNGVNLGKPRDFFFRSLGSTQPTELGEVTVVEPRLIFSASALPKNAASSGMNFGLDYVKLIPTP